MSDALYDVRLTEHFKAYEFRCRGGTSCSCHGRTGIDRRLVDALEIMRDSVWKGPMFVTSGYRCDTHNKFVGGHPDSLHRFGMAADIAVPWSDRIEEMGRRALEVMEHLYGRNGGVIIYPNNHFMHVDIGDYTGRHNFHKKLGRGLSALMVKMEV